jgi:hypothetical protein
MATLGQTPPHLYDNYVIFLTGVAQWVAQRAASPSSKRTGLACEVIRATQDVWCGIGVYTVCEVFFDAGMLFSELASER